MRYLWNFCNFSAVFIFSKKFFLNTTLLLDHNPINYEIICAVLLTIHKFAFLIIFFPCICCFSVFKSFKSFAKHLNDRLLPGLLGSLIGWSCDASQLLSRRVGQQNCQGWNFNWTGFGYWSNRHLLFLLIFLSSRDFQINLIETRVYSSIKTISKFSIQNNKALYV